MTLRSLACTGVLAFTTLAASAQTSSQTNAVSLVPPHATLLPESFGAWKSTTAVVDAPEPPMSLVNARQSALEEDQPQRSQTANYTLNGRTVRVEAVEFSDATGAYSAYTLLRTAGVADTKDLGTHTAAGKDAVLFTSGAVLAVVYPATAADVKALKALELLLPKVHGSQAAPPLLPTFVPAKSLEPGSIRYAIGPATYAAQGGVLPASSIGWDKSAEAVTARFVDKRGDETLTLLLYPTQQIARAHLRSLQGMLPGLGPKFATAKARQENEIVMLASGTFPPEAAEKLVGDIHMRQDVTFDKAKPPEFHAEVQKTYSLLTNIMVLSGVLMGAAVLLGLFLGYGRAAVRVMRGKSAAVEPEFLALHLAPQNATPKIDSTATDA